MIHTPLRNSGRSERGREQDPNKREGGTEQREAGEQVGTRSGAVQVNSAKPSLHTVKGQPGSENWIYSAGFTSEEALEMLFWNNSLTE